MKIYEYLKARIESTEDLMEKRIIESLYRDCLDYESDTRSQRRQTEELKRALDFDLENLNKGYVATFVGVQSRADHLNEVVVRLANTTNSIKKCLHFLDWDMESREEFWASLQAEVA